MSTTELTLSQQLRIDLLAALNYDTAATAKAIEFVQDDPLKFQLFIQQHNRAYSETEPVAKTIKAIQEATEALTLFDNAGS